MAKDNHFVDDFWCSECGSMVAIDIKNSKYVRCIGCLVLFEKGPAWSKIESSTIHPICNGPPLSRQEMR